MGGSGGALGEIWEALAELREALGELWEGLYTKTPDQPPQRPLCYEASIPFLLRLSLRARALHLPLHRAALLPGLVKLTQVGSTKKNVKL